MEPGPDPHGFALLAGLSLAAAVWICTIGVLAGQPRVVLSALLCATASAVASAMAQAQAQAPRR